MLIKLALRMPRANMANLKSVIRDTHRKLNRERNPISTIITDTIGTLMGSNPKALPSSKILKDKSQQILGALKYKKGKIPNVDLGKVKNGIRRLKNIKSIESNPISNLFNHVTARVVHGKPPKTSSEQRKEVMQLIGALKQKRRRF